MAPLSLAFVSQAAKMHELVAIIVAHHTHQKEKKSMRGSDLQMDSSRILTRSFCVHPVSIFASHLGLLRFSVTTETSKPAFLKAKNGTAASDDGHYDELFKMSRLLHVYPLDRGRSRPELSVWHNEKFLIQTFSLTPENEFTE